MELTQVVKVSLLLLVRLFSIPVVTPLCRNPVWGGLSLVPLITVIQVCLLTFVDF